MARNDAIDNPVRSAGKETSTGALPISQRETIDMDTFDPAARTGESLVAVDIQLNQAYLEALSFAEEPVCIRIERSSEKFAPKVVDCWVNGKGAEVFSDGKWITLGFLPVGQPIITRRKYVEGIARAKRDTIDTKHVSADKAETEYIDNSIDRNTSAIYPFSMIRDNNPKGVDWLTKVMAEF